MNITINSKMLTIEKIDADDASVKLAFVIEIKEKSVIAELKKRVTSLSNDAALTKENCDIGELEVFHIPLCVCFPRVKTNELSELLVILKEFQSEHTQPIKLQLKENFLLKMSGWSYANPVVLIESEQLMMLQANLMKRIPDAIRCPHTYLSAQYQPHIPLTSAMLKFSQDNFTQSPEQNNIEFYAAKLALSHQNNYNFYMTVNEEDIQKMLDKYGAVNTLVNNIGIKTHTQSNYI